MISIYEKKCKLCSLNIWNIALILFVLLFTSCKDDDTDPGREGWIRVLPLELNIPASGGNQEVYLVVTEDVDLANVQFSVIGEGKDWCYPVLEDNLLKVTFEPNYYEEPRATVITLTYGDLRREIPVTQAASSGSADVKIEVTNAEATTEEVESEQRGIINSYDGDYISYFNSKFGAFTDWPFLITYTLKDCTSLDYIIYHPRTDNGTKYGAFNDFEVWVSTEEKPEFVKVKEYTLETNYVTATILNLNEPVKNVKQVRFVINAAHNNRISCAEMEFFRISANKYDYTKVFTDNTCSELREGITETDIRKMPGETYKKLATALLNGSYNPEYRVAEYRPYQNPNVMAEVNKTSTYSLRDNPTGIYVEQGEELTVLVGDTKGQNLSMIVQDLRLGYNSSKSYALKEGENTIKILSDGLVYIQNLTNEKIPLTLETEADKQAAAAKTVKIHFPFDKVNGYFDAQTGTQAEFEEVLRNAKYQDIDVLGKYVHITWTVNDYKEANTPILEVMDLMDEVVRLEWDFMGLFKYNKLFGNRMYLHVEYNSKNPYSAANHTAYLPSYKGVFCTTTELKSRVWVLGHEIGHSNQTRPGLKWTGTTEVTNNICANYVRGAFGKGSRLMDQDKPGMTVYEEAIQRIIEAEQPHCLDNASDEYYVKLVPFWQLKLYIMDVLGQEDFYRDLYEHYRTTPDLDTSVDTQGILQLDFVRQVCNGAKIDFLDFFEKWGFLRPVDKTFNDYGNKNFTVTQKQIDDLKAEIRAKGYNKAPENLYLITDENFESYKK